MSKAMIRKEFIPQSETVTLTIPRKYVGVKLEIIAYPVEEDAKKPSRRSVTFTDFGLDAPDYKFNREEANAR
jgi:hypothetical protein